MSEAGEKSGLAGVAGRAALWAGAAFAVCGALLTAAGPLLYRGGMLPLAEAREGLQHWAFILLGAGVALALLGVVLGFIARDKKIVIPALALLIIGGMSAGKLFGERVIRDELPPIHDVQTDWSRPVAYSLSTLREREARGAAPVRDDARIEAANARWAGRTFGEAQAEAYDLQPITVPVTPAQAIVAAEQAAKNLGWLVVYSDPQNGQLEAAQYSFWYGLGADIAVRAVAEGEGGARIDVRSTSRDAGPDMGANANRVKAMINEVAFALRGRGAE